MALQLDEGRWRSMVQRKFRLQGLTCMWVSGWGFRDTAGPAQLLSGDLAIFGV